MKNPTRLLLLLLALPGAAQAQSTIEGFWQDTARRILFDRRAPSSGGSYELVDLLYDDEYAIKVVSANADSIQFIRSAKSPACSMHHRCRLDGEQLFCSLENVCREDGSPAAQLCGRTARKAANKARS